MPLFKKVPSYNFMGRRRQALTLSAVVMLLSFGSIFTRGLNFGIDFTGGLLLEVGYENAVELETVRGVLAGQGYPNALVQNFGSPNDVLIRLPPPEDEDVTGVSLGNEVLSALRGEDATVALRRVEEVGRQVGDDLTEQGGLALLFALIMIFGYVMLRFRWKFAAGAIAALVHDVVITVGILSVTGIDFDLPVLAAVLAVIGYSLNDTIVVYDRIRENFKLIRRGSAEEIVNTSVNQTLARTLITGITTLLVLGALLFLGGQSVFGFAVALIIGVLVGTYSSIYVASAAALLLDVSPTDLIPPKREEVDDLP